MQVSIITPYYQENVETLLRCYRSIKNQNYTIIRHVFIADGHQNTSIKSLSDICHLELPMSHHDAGATPRAIAALSEFSNGADAIAFLDADNTFESNHIETLVSIMKITKADVVTATRNICDRTGSVLYTDNIESNGTDFCDTNCYLIYRSIKHLLGYWVVDQSQKLLSDRYFWAAIKNSQAKIVHSTLPSVNYYSKWAWHYHHAGVPIPLESVWINTHDNIITHEKHDIGKA
jgi:glycosyltransferase involved in cell wall biosynthesis